MGTQDVHGVAAGLTLVHDDGEVQLLGQCELLFKGRALLRAGHILIMIVQPDLAMAAHARRGAQGAVAGKQGAVHMIGVVRVAADGSIEERILLRQMHGALRGRRSQPTFITMVTPWFLRSSKNGRAVAVKMRVVQMACESKYMGHSSSCVSGRQVNSRICRGSSRSTRRAARVRAGVKVHERVVEHQSAHPAAADGGTRPAAAQDT